MSPYKFPLSPMEKSQEKMVWVSVETVTGKIMSMLLRSKPPSMTNKINPVDVEGASFESYVKIWIIVFN